LKKTLIFGNSGAGKSTLAKKMSKSKNVAHLDLDSLAWLATSPPQRKPINDSAIEIVTFTTTHSSWVIEGCYSDLLELLMFTKIKDSNHYQLTNHADEIIFLDLPIATCITNAKNRPWEPHKYPSKLAQDDNLEMLIDWIKAYETRTDNFSRQSHRQIYDNFSGKKTLITKNN
jgi:adenylate kinase family enzyme